MADTRTICVPCNTRMECKKNGVYNSYAETGAQAADLWECPNCGHQIMEGFSAEASYAEPGKDWVWEKREKAITSC